MEEQTAEQLKASMSSSETNSNSNVRTRVNTWVSSFVKEMKIKRPAVQKLVDSVPANTSCVNISDLKAEPIQSPALVILEADSVNSNELETTTSGDDELTDSTNLQQQIRPESNRSSDVIPDANVVNRFWAKPPAILSTFSKSSFDRFYPQKNKSSTIETNVPDKNAAESKIDDSPAINNSFQSIGRAKINELYNKLSISRNKLHLMREKRMEAKQLIEEARDRLLASRNTLLRRSENFDDTLAEREQDEVEHQQHEQLDVQQHQHQMASLKVCDNLDMDISLDELSHVSRSTENISADDSLAMSLPSIDDGIATTQHLNVGRKIAIGEIGRSTSDNPRLRHKFHLGDIGRSFSENQDDESIVIGERNISAPSSSIAIENNNRGHSDYFERRAFSVSPTQSNARRSILFRDQSLNERSSSRTSGGAKLNRDSSQQSDSSRCSSVESLLDARRPDSEAILRHLGFGPVQQEDLLSKIPKRFLKPSQVRGIDTEAFLRQQLIASNIHEQAILGYRGLVGNPHVAPSLIVTKLMERFQLNDERSHKVMDIINANRPLSAPPTPGPNFHDDVELS